MMLKVYCLARKKRTTNWATPVLHVIACFVFYSDSQLGLVGFALLTI